MMMTTLFLSLLTTKQGGLRVHKNSGQGKVPEISWTTAGHTVSNVPLYGWGKNAQQIEGIMNNTDVIKVVSGNSNLPDVQLKLF